MPAKLGWALAIIGGSTTLCGLMAWNLVTRHSLDFSDAAARSSMVQAATMQAAGPLVGTPGVHPPEAVPLAVRLADHPAVRYAQALMENDCDTVIGVTLWMGERLQYVRLNGGDDAGVRQARDELCRRMTLRRLEDAQWAASGVEDRYVFAPGSQLEVMSLEDGRSDLERPAAECVVFRVTYPAPERALRDASGLPVRSLEARIWVSGEGFVLKAGVLGDAEVDPESFGYEWQ